MHLCSWATCRKPYPTLADAAKNQHEFCFENTYGDVIAVWCPQYLSGICLPGWHFHYLSSDKTQGGHILDLSVDRLHMKIHRIEHFDLTLPQNTEFAQRDLCEELSAKTAAVESTKSNRGSMIVALRKKGLPSDDFQAASPLFIFKST